MGRRDGVTVVTAAWRGERLEDVRRCLTSQSRRPDEWIVVNDDQDSVREWHGGVGAGSCLFVDLGRRFGRYGLYGRNIGAMAASHGRVLFLDDDNTWPEDFVERMVSAADSTGRIPYADMVLVGKVDRSYRRERRSALAKQNVDLGCLMYSRDIFDRYGYFRDDKRFHTCFDWELISRILEGEGEDGFVRAGTHVTFSHKLR